MAMAMATATMDFVLLQGQIFFPKALDPPARSYKHPAMEADM